MLIAIVRRGVKFIDCQLQLAINTRTQHLVAIKEALVLLGRC